MFSRLEGEIRSLLNEVIELAYFMRGAISYEELMNRTYVERHAISEFLDKRLEAESEKFSPNY